MQTDPNWAVPYRTEPCRTVPYRTMQWKSATTCQLLIPQWEEQTPSLLTYFYSFTLIFFLFIESFVSLSSDRVWPPQNFNQTTTPHPQPTPNHWLPKTTFQQLLNFQPISNLGKPPFCKDHSKRESLNTKATQVQTPDSSWADAFNINVNLIEKLNARVN